MLLFPTNHLKMMILYRDKIWIGNPVVIRLENNKITRQATIDKITIT